MNDTYFVKHLPVLGEVKEGDIVLIQGRFVHNRHGHNKEIPDTKYKPFLCSKNIQKDDKFFYRGLIGHTCHKVEMGSGKNYYPEKMLVWYVDDQDPQVHYWLLLSDCYKIIGEVSPFATWLVEGSCVLHQDTIRRRIFTDLEVIEFYEIKGPCGHFH